MNVMRNTRTWMPRTWMLGLTLAAGLLTAGAATANAAPREFRGGAEHREFAGRDFRGGDRFHDGYRDRRFYRGGVGIGVGFDAGYIPPCPGDGYTWTAGYYNGGIWVPGAWVFRGGPRFAGGYIPRRDFGYGRARVEAGRGFDRGRGFDHGAGRGFERGRR